MPENPDLARLRAEYHLRDHSPEIMGQYSLFNISQLFMLHQRQRDLLRCLQKNGFNPLANRRILEVGCGDGGVLLDALSSGAIARNLHGVDVLHERLQIASRTLPGLSLICADGQYLPYEAQSFDLAMQLTVFSSILDEQVRFGLANEMLRVLKPGGIILWYDFWLNPTNPQTRGIHPTEIRRLFPNCTYNFHRITLAPPITRRLVPLSWGLALLLESLRILNTHYLAVIKPLI